MVLVAGGLGLAPLRLVVRALLAERNQYGRLTLIYGARRPADLLYASEYTEWERRGMEILVTVDHADGAWNGRVGVVPVLFSRLQIEPARTVVIHLRPGDPDAVCRLRGSEPADVRSRHLLLDGAEHAMRGGNMRPLSARAGVSLQGRSRVSRTGSSLPSLTRRCSELVIAEQSAKEPALPDDLEAMTTTKPRLGVFKFASCDGCQLSLLDCEDQLLAIADRIEIAYFLEAIRRPLEGEFDVALVEGSVSTPQQEEEIRDIRRRSRFLITLGACASARRYSGSAELRQPERGRRPGDRVCVASIHRDLGAFPACQRIRAG